MPVVVELVGMNTFLEIGKLRCEGRLLGIEHGLQCVQLGLLLSLFRSPADTDMRSFYGLYTHTDTL